MDLIELSFPSVILESDLGRDSLFDLSPYDWLLLPRKGLFADFPIRRSIGDRLSIVHHRNGQMIEESLWTGTEEEIKFLMGART